MDGIGIGIGSLDVYCIVWFPDPLGKCQNQTRWCIEHLAVGQNGSSGMPGGITFIGDIYILFGCSSYKLASHNGLL